MKTFGNIVYILFSVYILFVIAFLPYCAETIMPYQGSPAICLPWLIAFFAILIQPFSIIIIGLAIFSIFWTIKVLLEYRKKRRETKLTAQISGTKSIQPMTVFVLIMVFLFFAAVIIVVLNIMLIPSGPRKPKDAYIKSNISEIRAAAEIYWSDKGNNSYGIGTSSCDSGMFKDDASGMAELIKNIRERAGADSVTCNVSQDGTAYAVQARLLADKTKYFCADSTGTTRPSFTPLGSATVCPN